jgi:hypothetical protein
VVSHSCDIARAEHVEPDVEIIVGVIRDGREAGCRNGHSIRQLHVPTTSTSGSNETSWLELEITEKRLIDKAALFGDVPCPDFNIGADAKGILQRWLAQRYSRSQLPDSFVEWLQQLGIEKKLESLAKKNSDSIVAIYFDLDDARERADPADFFELGIYIVYATGDADYAGIAQAVATSLSDKFINACCQEGECRYFDLAYCDPIPDTSFTLHAANNMQRWRLEHRSLQGEPLDESNF